MPIVFHGTGGGGGGTWDKVKEKPDWTNCTAMIGGTALSSSATITDSAAQYKVISKSTGSTGEIFSKSVTLPKGLYSVMIRMKISAITSTASIFKLTIVDGDRKSVV